MHTDNFVKALLVLILVALVANLVMNTGLRPAVSNVVAPAAQAGVTAVEPGMVVVTTDATGRTVYTWQIDDTMIPRYVGRDVARGVDRPVAPESRSGVDLRPGAGAGSEVRTGDESGASAGEASGVRAGNPER